MPRPKKSNKTKNLTQENKKEAPKKENNNELVKVKHKIKTGNFAIITGWGEIQFKNGIAFVKKEIAKELKKLENYE